MALVPYTITALERDTVNADSTGKQIVVGAVCSMFIQPSDSAVLLYDDSAGSNPSSAKTTGANGQVSVYVQPGEYRVAVNSISSFVQVGRADKGTTTALIASNKNYNINDIVETSGFLVGGDGGGASWKLTALTGTANRSPLQLNAPLFNDGNGSQWALITNGVIDPAKLGATKGTTSASDATAYFAILSAHCESTDDSWTASGSYWVESIDVYTSFVGDADFYSSNNGQSVGVVNIKPKSSDLSTGTLSDINSSLPLAKGQTNIPLMGSYSGKVVRVASPSTYLKRNESNSSYRYDITFIVLNSSGDIYPPIPHEISGISFTAFETEILRENIDVSGLSSYLNTGSLVRNKIVFSNRSNTTISINAENKTSTQTSQIFEVKYCALNNIKNCVASGAKVATTNYAYNLSGCGHSLVDCFEYDCRRGFDGAYLNGVSIRGGSYPDGIGAHLGFNLKFIGLQYIGYSSQNGSPMHFTGGDIEVASSRIATVIGAMFSVRSDAPEIIGTINIHDNELIFDLSQYTGSGEFNFYSQTMPSTAYDGTRDLFMPDNINVLNNKILVNGDSHTAGIIPLALFTGGSAVSSVFLLETEVNFTGNSYKFENNLPIVKIVAGKTAQVGGSLLKINFNDHVKLDLFLGNVTNTTVAPFIEVNAPNISRGITQADYGWLKNSNIKFAKYQAASGTPAYQSDSRWKTITEDNTSVLQLVVLNDNVIELLVDSDYFSLEYWRANDISRSAKYIIDADGAGQVGSVYENGAVANAGNTVLTGTTGADGKISLSCDSSSVYIENRAGNGATLIVRISSAYL